MIWTCAYIYLATRCYTLNWHVLKNPDPYSCFHTCVVWFFWHQHSSTHIEEVTNEWVLWLCTAYSMNPLFDKLIKLCLYATIISEKRSFVRSKSFFWYTVSLHLVSKLGSFHHLSIGKGGKSIMFFYEYYDPSPNSTMVVYFNALSGLRRIGWGFMGQKAVDKAHLCGI